MLFHGASLTFSAVPVSCQPETDKRLRPLALLLQMTARPALVFILLRKPWVRFRFMLLG
jgi:hypothetical protein